MQYIHTHTYSHTINTCKTYKCISSYGTHIIIQYKHTIEYTQIHKMPKPQRSDAACL